MAGPTNVTGPIQMKPLVSLVGTKIFGPPGSQMEQNHYVIVRPFHS